MQYKVSNRVFWAAVFLAGCAVVSGRSQSQNASSQTAKVDTFDTVRLHRLELVDNAGHVRLSAGITKTGGTSVNLYRSTAPYDATLDISSLPFGEPGTPAGTTTDCVTMSLVGKGRDRQTAVVFSTGKPTPLINIYDTQGSSSQTYTFGPKQ